MKPWIDFLTSMLPLLAVPLAGLLADLIVQARKKMNRDTSAQEMATLESKLAIALNAGIAFVNKEAPDIMANGIGDPAVQARILAIATGYLQQRFPDEALRITAAAGTGTRAADAFAAVQQTLSARLIKVIPDVPSVTPPGVVPDGATVPPATTLPAPS